MSSTILNPPPTPVRGVPRLVAFTQGPAALPAPVIVDPAVEHPLTDRFHAAHCVVCLRIAVDPDNPVKTDALVAAFVDQVAVAVALFDPPLTPGQKRVFDGERARLFRMLDARTPTGDLQPGKVAAVLELLDDMAGQAPAVDAVIAAEDERRRQTAAARPTVALALASNRRTP